MLRRHNLNQLPILRELLRTRSVSRTAELVGLSQSAVSAALSRLRETFNDDLLVMVGRRLELTERGAELIEQTERAYLEVETLLRPPQFDPLEETRRFIVATADYVSLLIAPPLTRLLAQQAPNASVHFIDVPGNVASEVIRGTIDLVMVPSDTAEGVYDGSSMPLFDDEMVVISSRAHRGFAGPLTREIYETSRHAMFQMSPKIETTHQILGMREGGIEQHNRVIVQQFTALPAIVASTDCLALVQRRIAERFARVLDIEIHTPPFEMSPVHVCAYWGRSMERDPAHAWFRGLLKEIHP
nr:LysR family transcriptional regulator [Caulobacter hibisci]